MHRDFKEGGQPTRAGTWLPAGVAIAGIWLAAVAAGMLAPDLVAHWIWGLIATTFVVLVTIAVVRAGAPSGTTWIVLALTGAFVATIVFVVNVFGPVLVAAGLLVLGVSVAAALASGRPPRNRRVSM